MPLDLWLCTKTIIKYCIIVKLNYVVFDVNIHFSELSSITRKCTCVYVCVCLMHFYGKHFRIRIESVVPLLLLITTSTTTNYTAIILTLHSTQAE